MVMRLFVVFDTSSTKTEEYHSILTKCGSDTRGMFSEVFDWSVSHNLVIILKCAMWTMTDPDLSNDLPNYHGIIFWCFARCPTVNMSSYFLKQSTVGMDCTWTDAFVHLECKHSELWDKEIVVWI